MGRSNYTKNTQRRSVSPNIRVPQRQPYKSGLNPSSNLGGLTWLALIDTSVVIAIAAINADLPTALEVRNHSTISALAIK